MFAGADPNVVDGAQKPPLHVAAEAGHDVIVSDLLVKGVDANAQGHLQYTPLHLAAMGGQVSCVSKLLLGGAEKDQRGMCRDTPLHLAARYNQLGALEELLAAKANPDIRDHDRCRPLDVAAQWNNSDVVGALLRHGCDSKACCESGYTALHNAVYNLYEPDLDISDAVHKLLEAGADVEAKTTDYDRKTPLHIATSLQPSSSETICALLEGGADVNARDADECTPLHNACVSSNESVVELLLRWGADETLVNQNGGTAVNQVGAWEEDDFEDCQDEEGRKADDQRIRHKLARAPADRSWRRRGWLVLARSRPAKVQLVNDNNRTSNGDSSAKVAKARCDSLGEGEGGAGEQAMIGLGSLVTRVVGLDAEGVFRLVVGFL